MDTEKNPLPEKERYSPQQRRYDRKLARHNHSLISKGVMVNPGENIQQAIDSVAKDGDGEVVLVSGTHNVDYNITVPQGVDLIGAGSQGSTVVDFGSGNYNISVTGTSGDSELNVSIRDIQMRNSAATAAIDLQYTQQIRLTNLVITNCTNDGVRIRNSAAIDFERVIINSCRDGFVLDGDNADDVFAIRFYSCTSQNNSQNGWYIDSAGTDAVQNVWLFGCRANDNTQSGFYWFGGSEMNSGQVNCEAVDNTVHGFRLGAEDISLLGCNSKNNTQVGYLINDSDNRLVGCSAEGNTLQDYYIALQANSCQILGCNIRPGSTTAPTSELNDPDSFSVIDLGENGSLETTKVVRRLKNNSGSERTEGEVVVWDTSTSGDQFTTTTSQGDDRVVGMVMETIANGEWGYVLLEGKTTKLKVNGTADITAGSFLETHNEAGISGNGGSGMAFAIALEGYIDNDSNGVIDALLISPRKV